MVNKGIAVFLIACILNPICCCFAGTACSDLDETTQNSCCENLPENSAGSSDKENCPHKHLAEINDKDLCVAPTIKALDVLSSDYTVLQLSEYLPETLKVSRQHETIEVGIPAPPLMQLNCTYLL